MYRNDTILNAKANIRIVITAKPNKTKLNINTVDQHVPRLMVVQLAPKQIVVLPLFGIKSIVFLKEFVSFLRFI